MEPVPLSPPNAKDETRIDMSNETTPLKDEEELIDFDSYTTSKSFAQNNLNLTAIGAQIALLLEVFNFNLTGYRIGLIVVISLSLTFQLAIFAMVAILAAAKKNTVGYGKIKIRIVAMNSLITFLTGCVLILALTLNSITVYAKLSGGSVINPSGTNSTG